MADKVQTVVMGLIREIEYYNEADFNEIAIEYDYTLEEVISMWRLIQSYR
jgi:hypothetical protein